MDESIMAFWNSPNDLEYYGTGILISGDLLSRLPPGRFLTRPIDRVVVYGKQEVTEAHELVAMMSEAIEEQVRRGLRLRSLRWGFGPPGERARRNHAIVHLHAFIHHCCSLGSA
mmetsp:Transcript_63692/g.170554  ORF Transcript_63692/g.170554 Transcript_63692/m.170554 type:complete len:114 (+) Transcript_63692:536-877(+)